MNADDLKEFLSANADAGYRDFVISITPGCGNVYGVRMPVLRKYAREVCRGDWREFLEIPSEFYEQKVLKAIVVARADMPPDERFEWIRELVPGISDWAVCDTLCGYLRLDDPQLRAEVWNLCISLMSTGKEFPMRTAAVMMLHHYLDEEHLDDVLDLLMSAESSGYYFDMGAAWALSYCYVDFPEKTERALFSDIPSNELRRLTVRKICESRRVPPEDKKRLRKRLKEV